MTDHLPVVLIVTSRDDVAADMVVRHLGGGDLPATVHRVDPADIETGFLKIDARISDRHCGFALIDPYRTTESEDIRAIWWRKPSTTTQDEGHAQLEGLLRTLLGVRWINHPDDISRAAHKPSQLIRAGRAGFDVPAMRIAATPEDAKAFAASQPAGVVAKTLAIKGPLTFVTDDWETALAQGPRALQTRIQADYHVRLTVVDSRLFAASVRPPNGELDWRIADQDASYAPIQVPRDVATAVHIYMQMATLFYGAFDFAVDHDGRWWFLECNSNGQSGFIELATGLPISRAIAKALAQPW
jgi:glutathione synthase/RimK-type ligase-like ATP-grasp enzyme